MFIKDASNFETMNEFKDHQLGRLYGLPFQVLGKKTCGLSHSHPSAERKLNVGELLQNKIQIFLQF